MAGDVLGNFSSDDLQDILEMDPELKAAATSKDHQPRRAGSKGLARFAVRV